MPLISTEPAITIPSKGNFSVAQHGSQLMSHWALVNREATEMLMDNSQPVIADNYRLAFSAHIIAYNEIMKQGW